MNYQLPTTNYLFGPVASRRLGRSLGIDLIPLKTCTLDCIYCECGTTTAKTIERKEYVPYTSVVAELQAWHENGWQADFITLAGSGEPTLHNRFADIISFAKEATGIPVCLLTNATLFYMPDVRQGAARADLVVPSLDAADPATFQKINRPHPECTLDRHLDGLRAFCAEYSGRLWIEIFLIPGINDSKKSIQALADFAKELQPEKIQINTAVRPPAEGFVEAISKERMQAMTEYFTPKAEIIASYKVAVKHTLPGTRDQVLTLLLRRPSTLDDIADGLAISQSDAITFVNELLASEHIIQEKREDALYYIGAEQTR
jgi:wyosine [tRNA(Phe)-imidazoG37] synthetase (radical SAM superfamily)